jgi:streptomycin 6-kinase
MHSSNSTDLRLRVKDRITTWRVVVEHMAETESSVLVFGRRDDQPVVVEVVKRVWDEWLSGAVLQAFEGKGVVRVFDYLDGALLLERLRPGNSLVSMALTGSDERATEILADVIDRMSPRESVVGLPTVHDWGLGFERYEASDNTPIPKALVEDAYRVYSELCTSQSRQRLLHGDLHHDNVLLDSGRCWLAIDPKGVVGETEYEVGAALRNPLDKPEFFLRSSTIKARVQRFGNRLHLNSDRILAWTFAQAVLSTIWLVEDGFVVSNDNPWIALAYAIRPMLNHGRDA